MKLQTAITLEEALGNGVIDQGAYSRLLRILDEALYETHRKTSKELTDEDLEKLNSYISRIYEDSILSIMRDFRFTDLTESFKIRPCFASLRLISFDKIKGEVKSKIILQSIDIDMVRTYDLYVVAQQEKLYGSQYLTFKLHDNLSFGCYDEKRLI